MEACYDMTKYSNGGIHQSLFIKLVEEIGELAEVLNKKAGRKASSDEDLQAQLGKELTNVIHYTVAIAALNGLDMNEIIIKNKAISIKYHHSCMSDAMAAPEHQPNICRLNQLTDWKQFATRSPEEYERWLYETSKGTAQFEVS